MKTITKPDESAGQARGPITWSLRGGTYTPTAAPSRGLGRLDEDRANSMTDEGGPAPVDRVASARALLEPGRGPARAGRPAIWHWDLASGRVEWNEGLKANFGYADKVTDAAWREDRIHPEDRKRIQVSLQRATIASPGAEWSDRYRLLQADGSYASVTERAYVVHDDAGPCEVLGAITRASNGPTTENRGGSMRDRTTP